MARWIAGGVCFALLWTVDVRAQDDPLEGTGFVRVVEPPAEEPAPLVTEAPREPGEGTVIAEVRHPVPLRIVLPDAEVPPLTSPEPSPRPRRRLDAGHLLGNAIVGDLIGAVAGALVSVGIAAAIGCQAGESSWLDGFHCASGYLYAIAIGALYGAALGGPLGVLRIGGARDGRGDAGMAMLAGLLGAGVGSITTGILIESTQEPTLALAIGGGVGLLTSTLGAVLLYDGSRPGNPTLDEVHLTPMVVPLDGGVLVAVGGALPR